MIYIGTLFRAHYLDLVMILIIIGLITKIKKKREIMDNWVSTQKNYTQLISQKHFVFIDLIPLANDNDNQYHLIGVDYDHQDFL